MPVRVGSSEGLGLGDRHAASGRHARGLLPDARSGRTTVGPPPGFRPPSNHGAVTPVALQPRSGSLAATPTLTSLANGIICAYNAHT